jgi:RNase P subunit RPR2
MSNLLTEEQKKAFVEYIKLFVGDGMWHCPGCLKWHDYDTTVSRSLGALLMYENASVDLKGPVSPLVQVICSDCGYTMFFNAAIIGVLDESLGVLPKEVTSLNEVKEKKRVEEIKQELIKKGF